MNCKQFSKLTCKFLCHAERTASWNKPKLLLGRLNIGEVYFVELNNYDI